MKRVSFSWLASLVLAGSFLIPFSPAVQAEPHPLIRRAVNALQGARTDLQNAAHDYCGHRVEALGSVQNALSQLKLAIQCDKK